MFNYRGAIFKMFITRHNCQTWWIRSRSNYFDFARR